MTGPSARRLDSGRLHLQHGPIDLLINADGTEAEIATAERAMTARFATVLDELVAELDALRADVDDRVVVHGPIARRMVSAARRHAGDDFATAMIAVAGSVADEIADIGWRSADLERLVVNNGGDIAIRQRHGSTVVGLVDDIASGRIVGRLHVAADSEIGGLATSGRAGRSLSLGIADAVTVLARTAAEADTVATLVANAVDLPGHPAVIRRPANDVRDDTDLGRRLVTVDCAPLAAEEIDRALDHGEHRARQALGRREIVAVVLCLHGVRRMIWGEHATPVDISRVEAPSSHHDVHPQRPG